MCFTNSYCTLSAIVSSSSDNRHTRATNRFKLKCVSISWRLASQRSRRRVRNHGCQMTIGKFLDCRCLALRAWRTTLQNTFLSLPPALHPGARKGRDQILPSGNHVRNCMFVVLSVRRLRRRKQCGRGKSNGRIDLIAGSCLLVQVSPPPPSRFKKLLPKQIRITQRLRLQCQPNCGKMVLRVDDVTNWCFGEASEQRAGDRKTVFELNFRVGK